MNSSYALLFAGNGSEDKKNRSRDKPCLCSGKHGGCGVLKELRTT